MSDESAAPDAPEWAIVELMGHRRRAGIISEVERFGATLLRVDIPLPDGEASVTELYGGSAIYAVRPCSEEVAPAAARSIGDPQPVMPVAYRLADERPSVPWHDDGDPLGDSVE